MGKSLKTSHLEKVAQAGAFVKLAEVQRELGFHPASIRKLCREGKLPAQLVGGRWFVLRKEWELMKRGKYKRAA